MSASHCGLCVPGDPGAGRWEWGEKKRRPPPGQTQISQHAGAEEEVQAGPLIQSQVSHNSLIAGWDQKQHEAEHVADIKASMEIKRF